MEQEQNTQPAISPWLLWTFIIVLILGAGYIAWTYFGQGKTNTVAPTVPTPTVQETQATVSISPSAVVSQSVSPKPTPSSTPTAAWKTPTDGTFTIKMDANTTKTVTYKIPSDWFFEKTTTFYPFGPLMMANNKACVDTYDDYFAPPSGCQIISISPALPGDASSRKAGIDGYNSAEGQSTKINNGDLVIRTFTPPASTGAFPYAIAVIGTDSSDAEYKYQETISFAIPKGTDNSTVASKIKQILATMTVR